MNFSNKLNDTLTSLDKLDNLINKHNVTWKWVKGHAGFEFNEKADELARKYIEDNI